MTYSSASAPPGPGEKSYSVCASLQYAISMQFRTSRSADNDSSTFSRVARGSASRLRPRLSSRSRWARRRFRQSIANAADVLAFPMNSHTCSRRVRSASRGGNLSTVRFCLPNDLGGPTSLAIASSVSSKNTSWTMRKNSGATSFKRSIRLGFSPNRVRYCLQRQCIQVSSWDVS